MEKKAVEMWEKTEENCKGYVFKGAGHCVNMDVPDVFNKIFEKFIKGEL